MKTINPGDKWAFHSGGTTLEIFQITGLKANPANAQADHQSSFEDEDLEIDDDALKPFEDFLGGVD